MSKQTRQQKREEENRILQEMQMPATYTGGNKKKRHANAYDETMSEKIHCKHCKTLMENGVCPTCGHTVYLPMDKTKRNKIRLIVTVVMMVAFVICFVALQIKNS